MKRIRRNLSPFILTGIGVWMIVNKNASMTILGIAILVLSGLGIVLNATDRESSKASRGVHIGLDGVFAAGGAWLLISQETLNQYLKYILGGMVVVYSLLNLRRMFRNDYKKGFKAAECIPVLLGVGLMVVPLEPDVFTAASGGVLSATGVITMMGNLFGKKKKDGASGRNEEASGAKAPEAGQ